MLDVALLGEEIPRVLLQNPCGLLKFAALLALAFVSGCHASPSTKPVASAHAASMPAGSAHVSQQVIDFVPQSTSEKPKLLGSSMVEAGSTHSALLVNYPFPGQTSDQIMLSEDVNRSMFDRPWLGVGMDRTPDDQPGVLVTRVVPDSPAARAGIQKGDALLLIDDEPVNASSQVSFLVQSKRVGTDSVVAVARNGKFLRFTLHLKPFPKPVELLRQRFVGKTAPALSGVEHGPERSPSAHSLGLSKDQLGKPIILVFWRPDCRECPSAMPHVNRWYSRYKGSITVIGVAVVEPGEVEREAKKLGIQYPTFADPHGTTTLTYSATLVPTLFLIDAAGVVRDVVIGSEPSALESMQGAIKAMVGR